MKDEIIIDFKEICHRIVKKWKKITFAAIVGLLLMSIIGYVNSYTNYKKNQPVDESTLGVYKSKLSEKELEVAEQAYDMYEVYKKQYQSAIEYNRNSILMRLGTDNAATVKMQYYIDNHYESVYPVIEQTNNATDIMEAYSLRLMSGEVMDRVKESTGTDIPERYLRELIKVEAIEDTQTMQITICTDSRELTDGIADVIEQEVNSYTKDIQEQYGEFDIIDSERCETTDIDDTLFDLQQKEITSITTLKSQIDSVGNNLNSDQKVYYNALINNAEATKQNFQAKIIEGKNIVLGCILGIFVAICLIIFKYISQKELRNQNDIRDMYHNYTFGVVKNSEQQISVIVDQIIAFAIRGGIHKIGLIGTDVSEENKRLVNLIATKIKEEKLEACIACGISEIPNLLKELGETNQVILVEKKNGSTYKNIEREIEMCEKCKVKILGNVIIDVE